MQILWVEDEKQLLEEGSKYLEGEGIQVIGAGSYAEAIERLADLRFDLVILDWMLPDRPGIELCRHIQIETSLPVIMLTAKTDEFDKVLALELGADDYVAKPFSMRELTARIRAVLRRIHKGTPQEEAASIIVRGDLTIDVAQHIVRKQQTVLPLTPTEFALLYVMASAPGRVFSRMQLMDEALGDSYFGFERTIDSHIRNLRKKLETEQEAPEYILTVHGIGYKFAALF